jgi:xylulose-5-phosphate/fructose-6-phosphate phosphoketolase
LKAKAARVYLPPDANTFMSTLSHCLHSKNYVNLMVSSKQPTPVYLSPDEAENHCRAGAGIFKFASTESGARPDVVLVGIGAELTFEVICAAAILRRRAPNMRIRVVNVTDLYILSAEDNSHPHALSNADYEKLFCTSVPIHFNYHGYSQELKGLIFGRPSSTVTVGSYMEEGSTTTPFDMMLVNKVSRYHVAMHAVRGAALDNENVKARQHELITELENDIRRVKEHILEHGVDPDDMYDTPKFD